MEPGNAQGSQQERTGSQQDTASLSDGDGRGTLLPPGGGRHPHGVPAPMVHTPLSTPHRLHTYCPHPGIHMPTIYTHHLLHPSVHTPPSTPHHPHLTIYTHRPHLTIHTPASTPQRPHSTVHTPPSTPHYPHPTIYSSPSTHSLSTAQRPHATIYTPTALTPLSTPHRFNPWSGS